jgi:hypothetical protein
MVAADYLIEVLDDNCFYSVHSQPYQPSKWTHYRFPTRRKFELHLIRKPYRPPVVTGCGSLTSRACLFRLDPVEVTPDDVVREVDDVIERVIKVIAIPDWIRESLLKALDPEPSNSTGEVSGGERECVSIERILQDSAADSDSEECVPLERILVEDFEFMD